MSSPLPWKNRLFSRWGQFSLYAGATVAAGTIPLGLEALGVKCDQGTWWTITASLTAVSNILTNVVASYVYDGGKDIAARATKTDQIVNHDLQKLIRAALAQVCTQSAQNLAGNPSAAKQLRDLAAALGDVQEAAWDRITSDYRAGEGRVEVTSETCIGYFEQQARQQTAPSHLPREEWLVLLGHIASQLSCDLSDPAAHQAAAVAVAEFPRFLRELAKEDFSANGEDGGKQFAAIHLSVMGNLAANVNELLDLARASQAQLTAIQNAFPAFLAKFEAIAKHSQGRPAEFEEVVPRLRQLVTKGDQILRELREGFARNEVAHAKTHDGLTRIEQVFLPMIADKDRQIAELQQQILALARQGVATVQRAAVKGDASAQAAIQSNDLAAVQENLVAMAEQKTSEALNHWRQAASVALTRGQWSEAQVVLGRLLLLSPNDLEALHLLASCYGNQGELEAMRATYDRLRASETKSQYWKARSYSEQGYFELKWRKLKLARDSLHSALAESLLLDQLEPSEEHEQLVFWAFLRLGDLDRVAGNHPAALRRYESCLALRQPAAAKSLELESMRDVALALDRIADLERKSGNRLAASDRYQQSLRIRQAILDDFGESLDALRDLSVSLSNVGDLKPELEIAVGYYRESLVIRQRIVDEFGESPTDLRSLSVSQMKLGDLEKDAGNQDAAIDLYRKSVTNCKKIVDVFGKTPQSLDDLSLSLWRVGAIALEHGDHAEARRNWEDGRDLQRTIFARGWGTLINEEHLQNFETAIREFDSHGEGGQP